MPVESLDHSLSLIVKPLMEKEVVYIQNEALPDETQCNKGEAYYITIIDISLH